MVTEVFLIPTPVFEIYSLPYLCHRRQTPPLTRPDTADTAYPAEVVDENE
jgi:hypothetical protein